MRLVFPGAVSQHISAPVRVKRFPSLRRGKYEKRTRRSGKKENDNLPPNLHTTPAGKSPGDVIAYTRKGKHAEFSATTANDALIPRVKIETRQKL